MALGGKTGELALSHRKPTALPATISSLTACEQLPTNLLAFLPTFGSVAEVYILEGK